MKKNLGIASACLAILMSLMTAPALVSGQESEGASDLDKAFELKITARSTRDLDKVTKLCESAIEKGLDDEEANQAKQLAASALYEHADQLERRISPRDGSDPDRRWKILRAQALSRLKKAIKYQENLVDAYVLTAKLNMLPGGKPSEAKKSVDKIIEFANDDRQKSQGYFMRATLQKDDALQLEDLSTAIKINPENIDAVRVRAAYFLRRQQPDKAIEDLKAWLDSDPENTKNHILIARQLMDMGSKFDETLQVEAIKLIDSAIATDEDNAELFTVRAQLKLLGDRVDDAIKDASAALKIDPKNIAALMIRASLFTEKEKLDEAMDDVEQILKIQPMTENAIRIRGIIRSQQGRFDEAIEDFVLLSANAPRSEFYNRQLAMLYNANDEPSKAVRIYNVLLKNNKPEFWEGQPDDVRLRLLRQRSSVLRGRGDAFLSKGLHQQAVKDYEEALELFDQINGIETELGDDVSDLDDGVLNNLAWVLSTSPEDDVRDGEKAIKLATEAAKLTEWKEAHILSTLAAAYAETGNFEQALKYVKQAVEVNRENGEEAVDKKRTDEQKESLQKELESYEKGEPWREHQDVEKEKRNRADEDESNQEKADAKTNDESKEKVDNKKPDDADATEKESGEEKKESPKSDDQSNSKPDDKATEKKDSNSGEEDK